MKSVLQATKSSLAKAESLQDFLLNLGGRKFNHNPLFQVHEIATAVDNGSGINLSWSQALFALRLNGPLNLGQRLSLINTFAKAQRNGHPHVYKLKLQQRTKQHIVDDTRAYKGMVRKVMALLEKGHANAAKVNNVFKLDKDERKQIRASVLVAVNSLKHQLDQNCKKPYALALQSGKSAALKKLKVLGIDPEDLPSKGKVTGGDLAALQEWYKFHDEATEGLGDDIMERVDEILDDADGMDEDDFANEQEFLDATRSALEAEDYRIPMYGWMAFSIAEDGQRGVFEDFNEAQNSEGADGEWKYRWMTAGDDDVCEICEGYAEEGPQYLDDFKDDPGGVHVYCRCDLEPVPPGEE